MRARGAQALTVLVLSVLAVAGAVGAPWYILAAERSALLADIATAPADQRVVTASRVLRLSDTDPAAGLGAFRATVERSLSIPGVRPVLGFSVLATFVAQPALVEPSATYSVALTGEALRGTDLGAILDRADYELRPTGIGLTSGGKALVGAEGRDGQDFAVVAGDGTIQLPPELLGRYPPGTLFTVDHEDGTVSLIPGGAAGVVVPPR